MAKARTKKEPRANSKRRGSADMKATVAKRKPEQTSVPGTDADRDKILERLGREWDAAEEQKKAYDEEIKKLKASSVKRLHELGLSIYKTSDGRQFTAELKTLVKRRKAPKTRAQKKVA